MEHSQGTFTLDQQIKILETLLKTKQNSICADCPNKTPRWASITFGCFVCLRCSGVHRQFGTHITKIKSVNLDKWPDAKIHAFMRLNNNLVNSYWEANLPANYTKPGQQANSIDVQNF